MVRLQSERRAARSPAPEQTAVSFRSGGWLPAEQQRWKTMFRTTLLGTSMLVLASCVIPAQNVDMRSLGGAEAHYRSDVNPDGRAGSLLEITEEKVPDLNELINIREGSDKELDNPEDKLRYPALREAALSFGARGGLAHTSRQINKILQKRAAEFNRIYDFTKVMVPGPEGTMVLPPVISEARDTYEIENDGKVLRLADAVYEIIEQARFAPVAPLWHSYLVRDYGPPTPPPHALLPKNDGERDLWKRWVTEGWMQGVQQAHEIFQADLNRLERDFTGMVRYRQLHAQGKVNEVIAASTDLGVTGTGQDMRVNDRALRITREATLEMDASKWTPTVSPTKAEQAATPPGKEMLKRPGDRVEVQGAITQNIDRSLSAMEAIGAESPPSFTDPVGATAEVVPSKPDISVSVAPPIAPAEPFREVAPPPTQGATARRPGTAVVPGPNQSHQARGTRVSGEAEPVERPEPPQHVERQTNPPQTAPSPTRMMPPGVSVRRF